MMPGALQEAVYVINTCKMFGCLPSQLMQEDARLMKYLALYELGGFNEPPQDLEGGE